MKKCILCFLMFLLVSCPLASLGEGNNLLANGSFEELSANGNPKGWTPKAYYSQIGYGNQSVTDERAHSGERSILIENFANNDTRFYTEVRVAPSSLYKLSAWVWVEKVSGGNGANLALEDIISVSDTILEPTGGWQYLEWYGETGSNQINVTFGVRLGGYGRESKGRVFFDDVVLEKVDSLPFGVTASLWYNDYTPVASTNAKEEQDVFGRNIAFILAGGIAFLLICLFLRNAEDYGSKKSRLLFAIFMVLGIVIRVLLALASKGYEVDINCFKAWSTRAASVGLRYFYKEGYFCDYPPAAILLLVPIGKLLNHFGFNSSLSLLYVKLLPILTDLLGAGFLFLIEDRKKKSGKGLLLSTLYLLNPAVLVTGAAWGQLDSVLALLIMLAVYMAVTDRWEMALPIYVFAVLVKPQALLVGPVVLVWLILRMVMNQQERKKLIRSCVIGLGISIGVAVLTLLPFLLGKDKPFEWLFTLYGDSLGSYAYATINAANLYDLFGANWTALETSASLWSILFLLVACGVGIWLLIWKTDYRKPKTKALILLLAALVVFLLVCAASGLSYAVLGYGLLSFVYLFAFLCLYFDQKREHLPFYIALVICSLFVFSVKIHERYLFMAIPLFLLAYHYTEDRRILALCIGFSLTTYLNTAIVLNNCILYGASQGHLLDTTFLLNKLMEIANLLLIGFAGKMAVAGLRVSLKKEVVIEQKPYSIPKPTPPRLGLRPVDWAIMLLVTAAYGVLCFTNLGSTIAPQTAFISSSGKETVTLKLEETSEFSVLYYCGLSYDDFSVAVSEDGENWQEEVPCEMKESQCYRWKYVQRFEQNGGETKYLSQDPENIIWFTGQYLRIKACEPGLNLWEIVARDREGNNLPFTVVSHEGSVSESIAAEYPAENVCDEMETCIGEPGWFNGTYFDEVYYARTAYELLHGQSPYETSHPPLGKLMMSACVYFFGMTPFGWRFAGAFLGMLMLPVMYLLCYQLMRKRSSAFGAMLALGFGLMHYTQTRLATIDTFAVFFIMLSFLFMIRFLQSDFFDADDKHYRKSLISLLLCGISMGLSIASKWTGIYSAMGLAILFFAYIIRRARVALPKESTVEIPEGRCLERSFVYTRILLTCSWCVIFFLVIPAAIYYLSYIPYFVYSGGITLNKLIASQISMFNYHSTQGLGADHPFYSAWWQWPLLMKPMWYAQDNYEPVGFESTIMCLGNQWVVYLGDLAVIALLVFAIVKLLRNRYDWSLAEEVRIPWVILIGFAVQFVPWVLVPRGTYIYHFFAGIPFLILATVWWIGQIPQRKWRYSAVALYVLGALVFFILYFPYASGILTSTSLLKSLKAIYASLKSIPGFSAYFNLWY